MVCKNCDFPLKGKFCGNCGQKSQTERVNAKYVLQEIPNSILQVDRGFFYTIKELFTRPGHSIREYLDGKRVKHYKPISLVLLLSAIYVFSSLLIDKNTFMGDVVSGFTQALKDTVEGGKSSFLEAESAPSIISFLDSVKNNYTYVTLLLLPFVALTTYISFLGKGYNYFEHLIINLYVEGQKLIIYLFCTPFLYLVSNEDVEYYLEIGLVIIPTAIAAWTFVQLFNKNKGITTILRLILSYVIYYMLFNFLMVLGVFIIVLLK